MHNKMLLKIKYTCLWKNIWSVCVCVSVCVKYTLYLYAVCVREGDKGRGASEIYWQLLIWGCVHDMPLCYTLLEDNGVKSWF